MNKEEGFKCCICGKHTIGWGTNKHLGNDPRPINDLGQCCDFCNNYLVVPARIDQLKKSGGD